MKKIVSFCLFGSSPKYTVGAIKNAILVKKYYKGWRARFYCDYSVPKRIRRKLKSISDTKVIMVRDKRWTGDRRTMMRFLAADSDDIVVFRDADSRPGPREFMAVEEWLNSDKNYHVMYDHPYHGFQAYKILAGMWGCRNGVLKGLKKEIEDYDFDNKWFIDQQFLNDIVFPKIKNDYIVHDEFNNIWFKTTKSFPIKRKGREFIGQGISADESEDYRPHGDALMIWPKKLEDEKNKIHTPRKKRKIGPRARLTRRKF